MEEDRQPTLTRARLRLQSGHLTDVCCLVQMTCSLHDAHSPPAGCAKGGGQCSRSAEHWTNYLGWPYIDQMGIASLPGPFSLQDLPGFALACDCCNHCVRYWPCHGHIEEVLQDFEVENLSYRVQKYYYDFVDKNDGEVAASILEYQFGIHGGVTTEPKCQPRIVRTS